MLGFRTFLGSTWLASSRVSSSKRKVSSRVLVPVLLAQAAVSFLHSCVFFAIQLLLNITLGVVCLLLNSLLYVLSPSPPRAQPRPAAARALLTAREIRQRFPQRRRQPLLQPALQPAPLTIALDLDETCVFVTRHASEEAAARSVTPMCETHLVRMRGQDTGVLEVVMRPDVREFLEHISAIAEVVVFTAARVQYAEAICDLLDPFGKFFDAVLSREHALSAQRHVYVKDLSALGRDLRRTILVDNSAYGFILQPENGLPVSSFRGEPGDSHLLRAVLPVIYALAQADDVRPLLAARYGMRAWFQGKGLLDEDDDERDDPVSTFAAPLPPPATPAPQPAAAGAGGLRPQL